MVRMWNRVRSLFAEQPQLSVKVGGGAIALITAALLGQLVYQSSATSFARYQAYQDNILALRDLETNFNQDILKSRYELFASYDAIVQNLAAQNAIHSQLNTIPRFIRGQDRRDIQRILEERQVALEQKDALSEWFKSRNALLKNSLRYLPFLTEQLETSFEAKAILPPPISTPADTNPSASTSPAPAASPATATSPTSPATADIITLTTTLNQLIRNLLLYTASADESLAEQTQALVQQIAQLENTLEMSKDAIPLPIFRSHANVILTTKPLVEELTGQLLLPLGQHTDELESTTKQAYQRASRLTALYRTLAILWILFLLGLANLLIVRRVRYHDPAFEQYQGHIKTLADVSADLQDSQANAQATRSMPELDALRSHEDDLGRLATSLNQWRNSLQQSDTVATAESFTFLAARLSFLAKNRRKLIGTDAADILEKTLTTRLNEHQCHLIDIQFEVDQVLMRFTYPETMQLSHLSSLLKTTSAQALYPIVKEMDDTLTSPEGVWSDAYLIASCEAPTPDHEQTLVTLQSGQNGRGEGE